MSSTLLLSGRPQFSASPEANLRLAPSTNHSPAHPALSDLAFSPEADAEIRRVESGSVAWDPRHDAGKVVFVREGLLRVYHGFGEGRQRLARLVGPGNWAGVAALAGANGSRTRVVASEDSTIALVDAGKLIELATRDPDTSRELIRQLARQAVNLNAQVSEITLLDCECQLVHALLRLSRTAGGERDGSRITLKLTQQDLADALGIARETVNGMIQKLAELQLISKRRGRISFDLVQLEQWATHLDAAGHK